MADTLALVQRNTAPEGSSTQSVDVLAHQQQGDNYWIWTVQGFVTSQTDAQIQNTLDGMVATVIAEILANNEAPLTAEQLSNYQNIIDLQQTQFWLDTLKADIDTINTASVDANALTGYREAFRSSNYTPLSNAQKFALLGAGMFAFAGILSNVIKAVRILLKRAKRLGT